MDQMIFVSKFIKGLMAKAFKKGLTKAGIDIDEINIEEIRVVSDENGDYNAHINIDAHLTQDQIDALVSKFI